MNVPAKKILVTGAFGNIGGALYTRLSSSVNEFDVYATDRRTSPRNNLLPEWTPDIPAEKFKCRDLADLESAKDAVRGMNVVAHLAANANPNSEFGVILHSNIVSTYNVFEACRIEGVERVIYASSIMTNFGYFSAEPYKSLKDNNISGLQSPMPLITKDHPVWPTEPYSASKVWGEALARAFSLKYEMSFLCVRIGAVNPKNIPGQSLMHQSIWCSIQDVTHLMECCVRASDKINFDIFYAMSNNRHRWVDTDYAGKRIGFNPQFCAEEEISAN